MSSFKATLVTAVLALTKLSLAQVIDPNSVSIELRTNWCMNQKSSCPLICLQLPGTNGDPTTNDCDPTDLSYSCICNNGMQPNASQYSQTIPYFECSEVANQCVNNCSANDSACQSSCRTAHPCGAQNPVRVNRTTVTTTSTAKTAAATGAASTGSSDGNGAQFTGFGGAAATATSAPNAGNKFRTIFTAETYGLGLVFAGFFAGFTIFL